MRTYEFDDTPAWICGHWNGSPIGIASGLRTEVGTHEVPHHHPYCEYYLVLEGSAVIEVGHEEVPVQSGMILMVEPNEAHQVLSVGESGVRWIVIQEHSEPNTKLT